MHKRGGSSKHDRVIKQNAGKAVCKMLMQRRLMKKNRLYKGEMWGLKKCSGDHENLISISEQDLSLFLCHVESRGQIFIINRGGVWRNTSSVQRPLMLL